MYVRMDGTTEKRKGHATTFGWKPGDKSPARQIWEFATEGECDEYEDESEASSE